MLGMYEPSWGHDDNKKVEKSTDNCESWLFLTHTAYIVVIRCHRYDYVENQQVRRKRNDTDGQSGAENATDINTSELHRTTPQKHQCLLVKVLPIVNGSANHCSTDQPTWTTAVARWESEQLEGPASRETSNLLIFKSAYCIYNAWCLCSFEALLWS